MWKGHLSATMICFYHGVCDLEKVRGVGVGGAVYANYRQLASAGGLGKDSVKSCLEALGSRKLVEYEIGMAFGLRATEVRRLIPVPSPSFR